jgi:hypothetical protein
MNNENTDRLYDLLPVIYRQRDAERDYPLRDLLRVINEQVDVVEADIAQLYENWFIETCQDWVVPYIGDLIGYRPVHEAGEPGDVHTQQSRQRNKILIPRREVANTIRYRRRKGTLALLELLANDVAGWSARAVEFYKYLGWAQAINHLNLRRSQTVDLRWGEALDLLDGPFDEVAHTVDVRRIDSRRAQGLYNIPSIGLYVWRLRSYPVTETPAYCLEEVGPHCFTFSVLGNDIPLYIRPERESAPTDIAGEMNLPVPIRRQAFEARYSDYYGDGKSLQIWRGKRDGSRVAIAPEDIIVSDLDGWQYLPNRGYVALDPELGRIIFPPRQLPKHGVWVSYHYGFSANIGGGEYDRPISQPDDHTIYQVGGSESMKRIGEALIRWTEDKPLNAVIEITDSGVYVEQINIDMQENQTLQLRAANLTRPVIRLLDWQTDKPDSLTVTLAPGSHFTLDGLLITGRSVQVRGQTVENEHFVKIQNGTTGVTIRHSTLVPGWSLLPDCEPRRPAEPSLELINTLACVTIEHSIVGSIQVSLEEVGEDPIPIHIRDSVLDATGADCDDPQCEALGAPGWPVAHAVLSILRSTVFGRIYTHAIDLGENSIFMGKIKVARRQRGCLRFCYITPGSRSPRRYHCQPEMVERAIEADIPPGLERGRTKERARLRIRPKFNSVRYGSPTYCQLAHTCAEEIKRGADDESEMGVFHDLYQPQRAANLRARLDEYIPAGMDAGIIFAS